ncbi:MAG: type II toxin-antitoxin system HicB family antitoxin [Cyclobacteriaceae bacterium]|jgi:antitoxin HicB
MDQKILTYRILLSEEPEGGFTVTVPALPGCVTYGETLEESMSMAKEAIEGYIEVLRESGKKIPDDSTTLEYSISIPA